MPAAHVAQMMSGTGTWGALAPDGFKVALA